jgi:exopolysaccharide biosynthesis polyprenyl glycosylphosphotransferase
VRAAGQDGVARLNGARPSIRPYNRRLFSDLCRSADVAVALLVVGAAFLLVNATEMPRGLNDFLLLRLSVGNLFKLTAFAFLWQNIFLLFGLYDSAEARSLRSEIPSVIAACTLGAIVTVAFALEDRKGAFSASVGLIAWPLTIGMTLAVRAGLRKVAERAERAPRRLAKRVLIVGSGPLAHKLYRALGDDAASAAGLIGFVDTNPDVPFAEIRARMLGDLDDLERILMHTVVDEVLIALPLKSQYEEVQRVIADCERAGVQSRYSIDIFAASVARARIDPVEQGLGVAMKVAVDDYRLAVKRALDILGAVTGMVALAPLLLLIAAGVKLTSPGPVLFAQDRFGWRKRRFKMLKFRTMVANAEALQTSLETRNEAVGPVFKIKDDPRITPIGRFLRKTSLDELPQLWNVFRGDMSLVGPRPLPVRDVNRFSDAWLMRRFSVVPGITGLWQVSGRSDLTFDQWVRLDLQYIDGWSLNLDLSILLRTVPAVLKGRGAS